MHLGETADPEVDVVVGMRRRDKRIACGKGVVQEVDGLLQAKTLRVGRVFRNRSGVLSDYRLRLREVTVE
jgi:hypothetical protein